MRLSITKSKKSRSYFVIEDVYVDGKRTTRTYEKLGNEEYIRCTYNTDQPEMWAKEYVRMLNLKMKSVTNTFNVSYCERKRIPLNLPSTFNGGYLFLQSLYYQLGIHRICSSFANLRDVEFDLNHILSRIIYTRILFPHGTTGAINLSKSLIDSASFELHQMYRSLEIINAHTSDFLSRVFLHSSSIIPHQSKILYYDFANYYFEVERDERMDRYDSDAGSQPNPMIQMGLYIDGNGIPMGMNLTSAKSTSEAASEKSPWHNQLHGQLQTSQFVYYSDSSIDKSFKLADLNKSTEVFYVSTQPIKQLASDLKSWALDQTGWRVKGSERMIHLREILDNLDNPLIYYKEKWMDDHSEMKRLVVTFSPVSKNYFRNLRQLQFIHEEKSINGPLKNSYENSVSSKTQGSKHFNDKLYSNHLQNIINEEKYDGYYAVVTNLTEDVSEIIDLTRRRWEIEENFRVMQHELRTHPVYLKREDRVRSHFLICYLSLLITRLLEAKLEYKYTSEEIVTTLSSMNFTKKNGLGYIPQYMRTELTDALHNAFGFTTDMEVITFEKMNEIINITTSY